MQETTTTESVTTPAQQLFPFSFTGLTGDYFRIWIANIALTALTLGIYSAWAKVRRLRFIYGHTVLSSQRFSYLAEPKQILKGRIIAVGIVSIFSVLWNILPDLRFPILGAGLVLVPALVVLATSFGMRNSAYRNLRFRFLRNFARAYRLLLTPLAVALLAAAALYSQIDADGPFMESMRHAHNDDGSPFGKEGIVFTIFFMMILPLIPYLDYARVRFLVDNTCYGKINARYGGGAWGFYKLYLVTYFLFLVVAGGIGALAAFLGGLSGKLPTATDPAAQLPGGWQVLAIVVPIYAVAFFVFGYFRARRTGLIFNQTAFGTHQLHAHMGAWQTGWLYLSNTVAAIFSLGLLIPWGSIRMIRYQLACTALVGPGLDEISAAEVDNASAFGEEMMDVLDLDLGL